MDDPVTVGGGVLDCSLPWLRRPQIVFGHSGFHPDATAAAATADAHATVAKRRCRATTAAELTSVNT